MALNVWKKLVAQLVAEILQKRGFRKNGGNFRASRPGIILTVGHQTSRESSPALLKFTFK
jgi:hypothetical protein